MDSEQKNIDGQIIDLLMSLNQKMDTVINKLSENVNILAKYDEDYQNEIIKNQ